MDLRLSPPIARGLPLFITERNRIQVGLVMFLVCGAFYSLTNHVPLAEPQLLPMTWIDRAVPFAPWTVWIYMSEWPYFAIIYLTARAGADPDGQPGLYSSLTRYFYAFVAMNLMSITIFVLWPTTYPRGEFPLPDSLDRVTYHAFDWLRYMDSPNNCAPSLHVSSVYLSALIFFDESRRKFALFMVWSTLIALSTLTTKQHYLFDLVSGAFLAVAAWWCFFRKVSYYDARGR